MFDILTDVLNNSGADHVSGISKISDILGMILNLVMGVGFSLSIIMVAYSAILHTMSGGNPDKTKQAWQAFLWSAIAGIITIVAFGLKAGVIGLIGVKDPNIINEIPTF